jgi:serine/threonine-protein kinase
MKLVEGQEIQFQSFNQKFNYIKELGSGGTGRTILVKDKLTNVLFAIKKFTPISKEYQEDLYR